MCDRRLLFGAWVWVGAVTASVPRAATLAWLGIEPWFVRKPYLQRGFQPLGAAHPLSPDARALSGDLAGLSAPPDQADSSGGNQPAALACVEPRSGITPSVPLNAGEIAFFAAPEAGADALWLNIQRCIPAAYNLRQCVAASGADTRIELGAQVWSLNTLRAQAAEKKRLWRLLVGIAV